MHIENIGFNSYYEPFEVSKEVNNDLYGFKSTIYTEALIEEANHLKSLLSKKLKLVSSKDEKLFGTGVNWLSTDVTNGKTHIGLKPEKDHTGADVYRGGVFMDDKILEARVYKEKNGAHLGFETYHFDEEGNLKNYTSETKDGYFGGPIDTRKTNKENIDF